MTEVVNYVKCRDDRQPVVLRFIESEEKEEFEVAEEVTWARLGSLLKPKDIREQVEPWLTALFQTEHLSILIGSGLTHGVHYLATKTGLRGMTSVTFNSFPQIGVAAEKSARAAGRSGPNLEDQIRVSNELLVGLRHYCESGTGEGPDADLVNRLTALEAEIEQVLDSFSKSILAGERGIVTGSNRQLALNYLMQFLLSFTSRSGTRDRTHIFTTNYDRTIEAGAELAGLRLIDRFVGSISPIFRSSRLNVDFHYSPPGIRGEPRYLEGVARFSKLHGSIDWIAIGRDIRRIGLPYGAESVEPFLKTAGLNGVSAGDLIIFPNSSKDRETLAYPYVEMFRDFAAAICRPNSTLVTYGYSFGDEHINRIIEDMLTIPSTHLVVISYDDPLGRIMNVFQTWGRPAQTSLLMGPHICSLDKLVDWYLPKAAIDYTSTRMSELLNARYPLQTEVQPTGANEGDEQ